MFEFINCNLFYFAIYLYNTCLIRPEKNKHDIKSNNLYKMRKLKKTMRKIPSDRQIEPWLVNHKSYIQLHHRRCEASKNLSCSFAPASSPFWKDSVWRAIFNFSMTLQMHLYLGPFKKTNVFCPFTVWRTSVRRSTPRFIIVKQQCYDKKWFGEVTVNASKKKFKITLTWNHL